MRRSQPLGLDELMIVNPGPPAAGGFFLASDGRLYRAQGLQRRGELGGVGQFFLAQDGTLYQVQRQGVSSLAQHAKRSGKGLGEGRCCQRGRLFLGEDGRLYEVIG
jgi:hypothetical protein